MPSLPSRPHYLPVRLGVAPFLLAAFAFFLVPPISFAQTDPNIDQRIEQVIPRPSPDELLAPAKPQKSKKSEKEKAALKKRPSMNQD